MSKNFVQTLAEINAGKVVDELTDELENLIRQVARVGGPGKLKLTLTIKPNKGGQTVSVDTDIDTTMPEFDRATDFFFIGKDFSLMRDHPDQKKLDLQDVSRDKGELVTINRSTGEVVGG